MFVEDVDLAMVGPNSKQLFIFNPQDLPAYDICLLSGNAIETICFLCFRSSINLATIIKDIQSIFNTPLALAISGTSSGKANQFLDSYDLYLSLTFAQGRS